MLIFFRQKYEFELRNLFLVLKKTEIANALIKKVDQIECLRYKFPSNFCTYKYPRIFVFFLVSVFLGEISLSWRRSVFLVGDFKRTPKVPGNCRGKSVEICLAQTP